MAFDLFTIIEPSVRNHPERTAIFTEQGDRINYRRFAEIVDSCALSAARAGISKGDHVGFRFRDGGTAHLCMIFALSKLGAVPAIYPPSSAASGLRVDYIITGVSPVTGPTVVRVDSDWLRPSAAASQIPLAVFDTDEDTALVMSSSGTTGRAKLLSLSLALINQDLEDKSTLGITCRRTLLMISPTTVFGLKTALLTLKLGGQIIWPRSPRATLSLLLQGDVDDIFAPPVGYYELSELLKVEGVKLSSINRATMGGSVASKSLIKSVQEHICRNLINHYGSSELGTCAFSNVDDIASIPGAVGKIVPWLDVRISDDHGTELPRGATGQLRFRFKPGRQMASYIGMAERTTNTTDGWFIPGDIGTLTEDEILCIQGRETDLINVGGNKIAPSAIEEFVNCFLGETEMVCAFGLPGPHGFEEVIVAIHPRNMPRLKELGTRIDESHRTWGPVYIMAINDFPLNEYGKIDKSRLREIATSSKRQRITSGNLEQCISTRLDKALS